MNTMINNYSQENNWHQGQIFQGESKRLRIDRFGICVTEIIETLDKFIVSVRDTDESI